MSYAAVLGNFFLFLNAHFFLYRLLLLLIFSVVSLLNGDHIFAGTDKIKLALAIIKTFLYLQKNSACQRAFQTL